MISSSLQTDPFRYVRHDISGTPTRTDIALAIEHALQHVDVPILWDLRGLELPQRADYQHGLLTLVDEKRVRMATRRRAFLVVAAHFAMAEALIRRLELSGEWSVFGADDEAGALTWLGG